ncbi:hypothetical protein, partial [Caldilinea sp.]|uniref:hypothetical protein n=1 Tax=Caldilinea sp. TaxID=2293560 RepID=UPI001B158B85
GFNNVFRDCGKDHPQTGVGAEGCSLCSVTPTSGRVMRHVPQPQESSFILATMRANRIAQDTSP